MQETKVFCLVGNKMGAPPGMNGGKPMPSKNPCFGRKTLVTSNFSSPPTRAVVPNQISVLMGAALQVWTQPR